MPNRMGSPSKVAPVGEKSTGMRPEVNLADRLARVMRWRKRSITW